MTRRLLTILVLLAPALALAACGGGGGYGGDLYIDGSEIKDTPSLGNLEQGLGGDQNPQPYVNNPLLDSAQQG